MERETKALNSNTTVRDRLYMALELSKNTWKVRFSDGVSVSEHNVAGGDTAALERKLIGAVIKFKLRSPQVLSCYEAGRDGFWLHRHLTGLDIKNVIVDPASIQVDRRAKQLKTDRIDAEKLLRLLIRHHAGEPRVWRVVRVPTPEAEDKRNAHRELDSLKRTRTRLSNTLTSLLHGQGVRISCSPSFIRKGLAEVIARATTGDGRPLGPELKKRLARIQRSYLEVDGQIAAIRRAQEESAAAAADRLAEMVQRLASIKGVGVESATVLVYEMFGRRDFNNRKEVGQCAGLAPVHYSSGSMNRDLGISKAGNPLIRRTMVQLAWLWIRWQEDSPQTAWFRERVSASKSPGVRKKMVTAVAHKLLIDFWRCAVKGVFPKGAALKTLPPAKPALAA